MNPQKKLGASLIAANVVGLITGFSFWLLGGVLVGLIGFLIGLFSTSTLAYLKHKDHKTCDNKE